MLVMKITEDVWISVENQSLLLGHDEGDAGAVRLQVLSGSAVEHGQRGHRRRNAAVSSHVPQLIRVPVDGVVVVQLNSAAGFTVYCTVVVTQYIN